MGSSKNSLNDLPLMVNGWCFPRKLSFPVYKSIRQLLSRNAVYLEIPQLREDGTAWILNQLLLLIIDVLINCCEFFRRDDGLTTSRHRFPSFLCVESVRLFSQEHVPWLENFHTNWAIWKTWHVTMLECCIFSCGSRSRVGLKVPNAGRKCQRKLMTKSLRGFLYVYSRNQNSFECCAWVEWFRVVVWRARGGKAVGVNDGEKFWGEGDPSPGTRWSVWWVPNHDSSATFRPRPEH